MNSLKNKIAKLNSFIPLDNDTKLPSQNQNTTNTNENQQNDKISINL